MRGKGEVSNASKVGEQAPGLYTSHLHSLRHAYILAFSSDLHLTVQQVYCLNVCLNFSTTYRATYRAHSIIPEYVIVIFRENKIKYEAPHYATQSMFPATFCSYSQIFFTALWLQTLAIRVPLSRWLHNCQS